MNQERFRRDFSIYKGTSRDLEILFTLGHHMCTEMDEDDELTLTVLDYRNDDEIVIQKTTKGDNFFSFIPSDTENLDVGFYRYNVKYKPYDSDDIYEVISPSIFHIKAGE